MAVDQPIIAHARDKGAKPSVSKMKKIAEDWAKRKETEESLVGKKIDLNEFLNSK